MTVLFYILCTFLGLGALWFLWACWNIIQKGKKQQ